MAQNKYYDSTAAAQVIGCTLVNPSLLDGDGQYFYNANDFTNEFHKVIFGAVYNLYTMGARKVNVKAIEDYLADRPQSQGIYRAGKGAEWVARAMEDADLSNFDYYYGRVKKMSLLRGYAKAGVDLTWLLDLDNIFDPQRKKEQEDYFDSLTLNQLSDIVDNRILTIRDEYVDNATDSAVNLGDGIENLLSVLSETPEMGAHLYGKYMDTITRGARRGKYYLRSAPTGIGKTRTMLADACTIACDKIYQEGIGWVNNGDSWPVLFVSTEVEVDELQTMALAFLTGINEEKILKHEIDFNDTRIQEAVEVLQNSKLYIEVLPDFTVKDVENTIKRNIRVNHVTHVFFDYVNSSLGLLTEVAQSAKGVAMREDTILFLLSTRLKELAVEFNIFVMSATQCNASAKTDPIPDANLLKGQLWALTCFITGKPKHFFAR